MKVKITGSFKEGDLKVGNVDAVVIAEEPKLVPFREAMKKNIKRVSRPDAALGIAKELFKYL